LLVHAPFLATQYTGLFASPRISVAPLLASFYKNQQ
jgi:TorA maturation chaperone TorD